MKVIVCDCCGVRINDPVQRVHMREIFFKRENGKKQSVHLCDCCLEQIAMVSKKRSDT